MSGGNRGDVLRSGSGNENLDGGGGNDVLEGGAGVDIFNGDDGIDTVSYEHAGEGVRVDLLARRGLAGDAQDDTYTRIENVRGSAYDDFIFIDGTGTNLAEGGGGADFIQGDGSNDTASYEHSRVGVTVNLSLGAAPQISAGDASRDQLLFVANLLGSASADALTGDENANTLNGGAGADTLTGGLGNDTYFVDNAGDVVIEADGEGNDIIQSLISYTLSDTQFIETLRLVNATGDADLNLTGNLYANRLIGNAGDNVLDGGGGADRMEGGAGDDTYIVDDAHDHTIESLGFDNGLDTVITSVSYRLDPGRSIERLETSDAAGDADLNLTGNNLENTIIGNAGDNRINGLGGADTMEGGAGDDTYTVDDAFDSIVESTEASGGFDTLIATTSYKLAEDVGIEKLQLAASAGGRTYLAGNEQDQRLIGNAFANSLDGRLGADVLQGGAGEDTFQFSTALGSGNVDHIRDFAAGQDTINFVPDGSVMLPSDGTGRMAESGFADITNGMGDVTADTRILYNKTTGALFYDADGSGSTDAVQFAILDNRAGISAHDFLVG